jgi:hypothetical protein
MPKGKAKAETVKDLGEIGAARVVRAVNRGIRESLAREAAYRRSKKKKRR